MAVCRMARLRVGWMLAGCTPGVRKSVNTIRFHWTTVLTCAHDAVEKSAIARTSFCMTIPFLERFQEGNQLRLLRCGERVVLSNHALGLATVTLDRVLDSQRNQVVHESGPDVESP